MIPRLELVEGPAGTGLRTMISLETGAEVIRFDGDLVPWTEVPPSEIIYVMMAETGDWVIPRTNARFVNHSCAPNLRFDATRMLVTTKPVRAGDDLTISYNVLEPFEIARREAHPDWYFWDERWSFDCLCGAPACQGQIDRYVVRGGAS